MASNLNSVFKNTKDILEFRHSSLNFLYVIKSYSGILVLIFMKTNQHLFCCYSEGPDSISLIFISVCVITQKRDLMDFFSFLCLGTHLEPMHFLYSLEIYATFCSKWQSAFFLIMGSLDLLDYKWVHGWKERKNTILTDAWFSLDSVYINGMKRCSDV